jgi:DNA polymerase-4
MHVDIDAFFASVEQILDPALRGKPVVVGGGIQGRGVVASASYEARTYGLKAGMPIYKARELCPAAVFIPGHHEQYNRFGERVARIVSQFSPSVEQASLDEFCVDLTGCDRMHGLCSARPLSRLPFVEELPGIYRRCERRAVQPDRRTLLPQERRWLGGVGLCIKRAVRERTGLDVSVGTGVNRLVAKAASDFAKPSGIAVVSAGSEGAFLAMLELKDIPGIGRAVRDRFARWNVRTVQDARRLPVEVLADAFGPARGPAIHGLLRGKVGELPAPIRPDRPKSISRETSFWTASNDFEFVESMLFYLSERLGRALRREHMEGRTVQVKVRYDNFATVQRSRSIGEYTDSDEWFFRVAKRLLRNCWRRSRRVRLVGVGMTDLRPAHVFQSRLFDGDLERSRRIDRCLDGLRERFGFDAVQRGSAIRLAEAPQEPTELPDISAMVRR